MASKLQTVAAIKIKSYAYKCQANQYVIAVTLLQASIGPSMLLDTDSAIIGPVFDVTFHSPTQGVIGVKISHFSVSFWKRRLSSHIELTCKYRESSPSNQLFLCFRMPSQRLLMLNCRLQRVIYLSLPAKLALL